MEPQDKIKAYSPISTACVHVYAYLFSSEDVSCQFDLGEVAFADGFQ